MAAVVVAVALITAVRFKMTKSAVVRDDFVVMNAAFDGTAPDDVASHAPAPVTADVTHAGIAAV